MYIIIVCDGYLKKDCTDAILFLKNAHKGTFSFVEKMAPVLSGASGWLLAVFGVFQRSGKMEFDSNKTYSTSADN